MGFKKLTAKLTEYNQRLADGKASKIKTEHVQKVLDKLRSKEAELVEELTMSKHHDKQVRITGKLKIAREQISRAEWLLKELA